MVGELNTLKSLTDVWWLLVLRGVLSIILGILALVFPIKTLAFLVLVIGILLIVDGVIAVISALLSVKKTENWWVLLVQGVVGLLVGLLMFNMPQVTVGVVLLLVALWAIVMGIMLLVTAISIRKQSYGGWMLTAGAVLSLLFAVVILANPYETVAIATLILGLFALVSGIVTTAFGVEVQGIRKDVNKLLKEAE